MPSGNHEHSERREETGQKNFLEMYWVVTLGEEGVRSWLCSSHPGQLAATSANNTLYTGVGGFPQEPTFLTGRLHPPSAEQTYQFLKKCFLSGTKINDLHLWHGLENSTVVLAGLICRHQNLKESALWVTRNKGKADCSEFLAPVGEKQERRRVQSTWPGEVCLTGRYFSWAVLRTHPSLSAAQCPPYSPVPHNTVADVEPYQGGRHSDLWVTGTSQTGSFSHWVGMNSISLTVSSFCKNGWKTELNAYNVVKKYLVSAWFLSNEWAKQTKNPLDQEMGGRQLVPNKQDNFKYTSLPTVVSL